MTYRTRWLLKKGPDNVRTRTEVAADAIYRAAGVAVPRSFYLTEENGRGWRAIEEVTGALLGVWWETATPLQTAAVAAQIRAGFVVDVLLGDLDAVGQGQQNVIVDRAGKAWRVDNGDALNWNPGLWPPQRSVAECVRALRTGAATQCIFGGLSDAEIRAQIERLPADWLIIACPELYRDDLNDRLQTLCELFPHP
jgi:hypothetical protein